MPDPSLPELARSLRSLGAARDPATEAAHDAIFAPLIAARVRAARAEGRDVVHSFRGATLLEAIERGARAAAAVGTERSAVARARSAAARDAIEPLRNALVTLDEGAAAASTAGAHSAEWASWIAALRRAFTAADEACGRLARVLAEPPRQEGNGRWFSRYR
jgi:16S rRNA G966 N2-methylase RsmD